MSVPVSPEVETSLRHHIDRATHELLKDPDWETNLTITDTLNNHPHATAFALKLLKPRLDHRKAHVQILSVALLSSIVDNCPRARIYVAEPAFLDFFIRTIPKSIRRPLKSHFIGGGPVTDVEKLLHADRVLICIRRWADAFRNEFSMPGFLQAYRSLNLNGVKFPELTGDDLVPIVLPPQHNAPAKAPATAKPLLEAKHALTALDLRPLSLTQPDAVRYQDSKQALGIAAQLVAAVNLPVLYDYAFLARGNQAAVLAARPQGDGYARVSSLAELDAVMKEDIMAVAVVTRLYPELKRMSREVRGALERGVGGNSEEKLNELLLVNDTLVSIDQYIHDVASGKVKRGALVLAEEYDECVDRVCASVEALAYGVGTDEDTTAQTSTSSTSTSSSVGGSHTERRRSSQFTQAPVFAKVGAAPIPAVIVPGKTVANTGGTLVPLPAGHGSTHRRVSQGGDQGSFAHTTGQSGGRGSVSVGREAYDNTLDVANGRVSTTPKPELIPAVRDITPRQSIHTNTHANAHTQASSAGAGAGAGAAMDPFAALDAWTAPPNATKTNTNTNTTTTTTTTHGTPSASSSSSTPLSALAPPPSTTSRRGRHSLASRPDAASINEQAAQVSEQSAGKGTATGTNVDVLEDLLNAVDSLSLTSNTNTQTHTNTNAGAASVGNDVNAHDPFLSLARASAHTQTHTQQQQMQGQMGMGTGMGGMNYGYPSMSLQQQQQLQQQQYMQMQLQQQQQWGSMAAAPGYNNGMNMGGNAGKQAPMATLKTAPAITPDSAAQRESKTGEDPFDFSDDFFMNK